MKRLNEKELFTKKESLMDLLNRSANYKAIRESKTIYEKVINTLMFWEGFDDCIDDLYNFNELLEKDLFKTTELKARIRNAFKRPIICYQIINQTNENRYAISIISNLICDQYLPKHPILSKSFNCYGKTYLMNKLVYKN